MINIQTEPRFKVGDKVRCNGKAKHLSRLLKDFQEVFTISEVTLMDSDPDKPAVWLYTMKETYQGCAVRYTQNWLTEA